MAGISKIIWTALVFSAFAWAQSSPAPSSSQDPTTAQPPTQSSPTTQAPAAQSPATQPPQASGQNPATPAPQAGTPTNPNANPTDAAKRIAPGSVIPVQLTKTIDAKKAKQGDEVVAKVPEDLKSNTGQVVIPKDTRMIGHVTEAQPHSKEQKESQVGIAFDRAVMKDGTEMQMPMSIQAIIGQQNNNAQGEGPAAQPAESGGGYGGGSRSGMGGSSASRNTPASGQENAPTEPQSSGPARPHITSQTQGVVGISNLKLESAPNATQGSVVSSEKNNVKLESGTMMLLKVNQ